MKTNRIFTKIKSNYKKIILDFIPVFFGILLALFLSDWKDQKKENEFISNSIINIYNDNKINIEKVNTVVIHLQHQLDSIDLYKNNKNETLFKLINRNKGIQLDVYNQTAWSILRNSQFVAKVDYEVLSKLTEIDGLHKNMQTVATNIADILYNSYESKDEEDKQRLRILLKDVLGYNKIYHKKDVLGYNKIYHKNVENLDSILQTKYRELLKE